ncbi:HNH endonuclease [Kitasatospora sp. NPDC056800]|uniref:HNH endonuclease n=1 Tax=Kitasatospora sp. NPDC056800 TaxID=3345948 RepID=UPI0036A5D132
MARRIRRKFPLWIWLVVLTANGGECAYCSRPAETMDHVIPFSRGGADDLRNLVPACDYCNNQKGDLDPTEWIPGRRDYRWDGNGTLKGPGPTLRDIYLDRHEARMYYLDHLEEIRAEILDKKRSDWIFDDCLFWHSVAGARGMAQASRDELVKRLVTAKAEEYPRHGFARLFGPKSRL